MRKSESNALLIVGGLVALNYFLKGRALSNLIFTAGQVQSIDLQGATPVIRFTITVQNTNSIGVVLQSIAGNIYTQDAGKLTLIGNISNFQPTPIPGNSESLLVLNCRCNMLGIINEIISAFQYKNVTKNLQVQAAANIDGVQFAIPEFSLAVGI